MNLGRQSWGNCRLNLSCNVWYGFPLMASTHPRKPPLLSGFKFYHGAPVALTAIGPPTKFPDKPWAKFLYVGKSVPEEQIVCCLAPDKIFEYSNLEVALAAVNMTAGPAVNLRNIRLSLCIGLRIQTYADGYIMREPPWCTRRHAKDDIRAAKVDHITPNNKMTTHNGAAGSSRGARGHTN